MRLTTPLDDLKENAIGHLEKSACGCVLEIVSGNLKQHEVIIRLNYGACEDHTCTRKCRS